jgi:hypothetical protein
LLWLAGVAQLIEADSCFLVTQRSASDEARALAARLHSEILDARDLRRREDLSHLSDATPYGTHAPELIALRTKTARTLDGDAELERVYRFARSDLWLSEPTLTLKRSIGACRVISGKYADSLPDDVRQAVYWLTAEIVTGFVLALTRVAGRAYRQPEDVFERQFGEALAEGLATYTALREISRAVDKYVLSLLAKFGVDSARTAEAIGGFEPHAPSYAEPLMELVQRLAAAAPAARDLARLSEYYLLGMVAPGALRHASPPAPNVEESRRLLRLVAVFLEGQIKMPSALLRPLRDGEAAWPEAQFLSSQDVPSSTHAGTEPTLFEEAAPRKT